MANLSAIKLPNGTTYNLKDNGALQLTGGQVTGPVTFGDSVSIDDLTAGQLVVEGSASIANNLQVNTINNYAISSAAANNTIALRTANGYLFATYLNQSSGAETPTTSSYIMYANSDGYLRKSSLANIKTILGLGTAAYTNSTAYLPSTHTYTTSIATSTATNQITLAYGTKYALTAGGTSYVFTMPSADDTNTWRKVQLNGTDKLGTGVNTNPLNLKAGTNVTITESSGTFTFSATDTNTHNTAYLYAGASNGTANAATTNGNTYLILMDGGTATTRRKISGSGATTVTSDSSGNIVISSTDTNTDTNTATAADNILDGSNSGTQITYAPYSAQQSKLSFDTSTTAPTRTDRLNLNGYLYATKLYSGGKEVLTSHQTITSSMVTTALGYTPYNSTNPNGYTTDTDTTINVSSGAVSFSVPTKTSHLTNDSGYITGISKSDVTTALGTGSGTTKFLREDGSWATPAYTTNTDTKVTVSALTSGTTYYPILATGTGNASRQIDSGYNGLQYISTAGTSTTGGSALLSLGNNIATGAANNEGGLIRLYGSSQYYNMIRPGTTTANRTFDLPNKTGTFALTSDIPSVPTSAANHTTGITASTTATKTTLGTAFTIPNVTSAGSASTWAFEDIACDDITSWSAGSGSASISGAVDSSDSTQLNITISHTHTAPTLQYTARTVSSKKSGANGSAPTLGTAFTVPNVSGNTSATVSITDNGHTHNLS
jgi:hypothetical protein